MYGNIWLGCHGMQTYRGGWTTFGSERSGSGTQPLYSGVHWTQFLVRNCVCLLHTDPIPIWFEMVVGHIHMQYDTCNVCRRNSAIKSFRHNSIFSIFKMTLRAWPNYVCNRPQINNLEKHKTLFFRIFKTNSKF